MIKLATISPCGLYRYSLTRAWGEGMVNFVMYNPSTADADLDDPTIRRCVDFARRWGYGGITVTNLFAYRATDPKEIGRLDLAFAFGPDNRIHLVREASACDAVVCAWGANPTRGMADEILRTLKDRGIKPTALRITKGGHPAHPLYLPARLLPVAI